MTISRNPSISLSDQHRRMVDELVSAGRFQGVSEVVREGLRLLEDEETRRRRALDEIERVVREGIESGPAGDLAVASIISEAKRRIESGPRPEDPTRLSVEAYSGYLEGGNKLVKTIVATRFGKIFEFAFNVNRSCNAVLLTREINDNDLKGMIISLLLMRAIENYQAVVVLLAEGMAAPARVMLRALLEAVFIAKAILRDERALAGYVLGDELRRLKFLRAITKNQDPELDHLRSLLPDSLLRELESSVAQKHAREFTIKEYSDMAGMSSTYQVVYKMLSQTAHTLVRDLEAYMAFDEDENLTHFNYFHSIDRIGSDLVTTQELLLLLFVDFADSGSDAHEKISGQLERVRALMDGT